MMCGHMNDIDFTDNVHVTMNGSLRLFLSISLSPSSKRYVQQEKAQELAERRERAAAARAAKADASGADGEWYDPQCDVGLSVFRGISSDSEASAEGTERALDEGKSQEDGGTDTHADEEDGPSSGLSSGCGSGRNEEGRRLEIAHIPPPPTLLLDAGTGMSSGVRRYTLFYAALGSRALMDRIGMALSKVCLLNISVYIQSMFSVKVSLN